MLKFFRHIRKKLLEQGKNTNYLKYAIGEIVLVVIDIQHLFRNDLLVETKNIAERHPIFRYGICRNMPIAKNHTANPNVGSYLNVIFSIGS